MAFALCVCLVACGGGVDTTDGTQITEAPESGDVAETEAPDYSGEDGDTYVQMDYMAEDLSKYVTLGSYKGMEIILTPYVVTEADIDAEIQGIIDSLTSYEAYDEHVTDRVTQKGDFVNIDYVGTMDGVPFEGGSNSGDTIVLAENNGYIDWFEDDLYGIMPGTTVTSTGKFPDDYHEHLAGKEVTFEITLNYIAGHYTIPEFTDELVQENTELETVAEYRELIREALQAEHDNELEMSKYNTMWQRVLDETTVIELPESQVMYYYTSERSVYEAYAAQYGVSYDDLLAQMGASDAMLMEYVNARVKEELIFYSIVKTEGIEVTDEDYAAGLAQYAADQGVTETELVEQYGEAYIRECILWDKLMVYLALQTTFTK